MSALMTPETTAMLAEILVATVGMIVAVALPMVAARVYQWTGLKIEEKHQKALHEAVATWAYSAVTRGLKPASHEAYEDLLGYLKGSVPDALKALGPTADVLVRLAGRYMGLAR